MKKFIIIAMMMVLFPFAGNAQLNVKREAEKFEKIASARTGLVDLMNHDERYYIAFPTTNQFDDPFIFYLGNDKESAIKTLKDLIELCGTITKEDMLTIDNEGKELRITKGLAGALYFAMDGYAGIASTVKSELNKFLKALSDGTTED